MGPHKCSRILFVWEAGSPSKGAFELNTNTQSDTNIHTHTASREKLAQWLNCSCQREKTGANKKEGA